MQNRIINGVPFRSDRQVAAHFNVRYDTYKERLAKNWTVEQAVGLAPSPKAASLTVDGVPYPTITALAKAFNQDKNVVRLRLSAGATPRQAVRLDPFLQPNEIGEPLVVDGVPYDSIAALAKAYDKPYSALYRRIQSGMDPKTAVTKPMRPDRRKSKPGADRLTVDGVPYPSMQALADAYAQNISTVQRRLDAGATPRQAVGLDPFEMAHLQDVYLVDGVPYDSIAQLAKAYGKPYAAVYRRIRNGVDPKTAVTKPLRQRGYKPPRPASD